MTYYSQFGEDRFLLAFFGGDYRGQCVEVGANDGVYGSTTLALENAGWACTLVEPNPDLARQLREKRVGTVMECAAGAEEGVASLYIASGAPHADGVSAISSDEDAARQRIETYGFQARRIEVPVRTLDSILAESGVKPGIDFVSIDVEGHELAALQGFDLAYWKPRILLIEDNSWFADETITRYLAARLYVPFQRTGVNDWYAHRDDRDLASRANLRFYAWVRWATPMRQRFEVAARGIVRTIESRLPAVKALRMRLRP